MSASFLQQRVSQVPSPSIRRIDISLPVLQFANSQARLSLEWRTLASFGLDGFGKWTRQVVNGTDS